MLSCRYCCNFLEFPDKYREWELGPTPGMVDRIQI